MNPFKIEPKKKLLKTENSTIIMRDLLDRFTLCVYGSKFSSCLGKHQNVLKKERKIEIKIPRSVWEANLNYTYKKENRSLRTDLESVIKHVQKHSVNVTIVFY